MILLDTNVISELMRARPDPAVKAWAAQHQRQSFYLSAITAGELWSGFFNMAEGKARAAQGMSIAEMLEQAFAGHILPYDAKAALAFGEIYQARKKTTGKTDPVDCQIAAIAKTNALKIATRNTKDFEGCGITIINPWQS